jgi:hypothetical protein
VNAREQLEGPVKRSYAPPLCANCMYIYRDLTRRNLSLEKIAAPCCGIVRLFLLMTRSYVIPFSLTNKQNAHISHRRTCSSVPGSPE